MVVIVTQFGCHKLAAIIFRGWCFFWRHFAAQRASLSTRCCAPVGHGAYRFFSSCSAEPIQKMSQRTRSGHCADSHSFFQSHSLMAVGIPAIKDHDHPQGLSQLMFENCVVKVRRGTDLTQLMILSLSGPVHLHNVNSCGWIASGDHQLPAFVFIRWLSEMSSSSSFSDELSVMGDFQQLLPVVRGGQHTLGNCLSPSSSPKSSPSSTL